MNRSTLTVVHTSKESIIASVRKDLAIATQQFSITRNTDVDKVFDTILSSTYHLVDTIVGDHVSGSVRIATRKLYKNF